MTRTLLRLAPLALALLAGCQDHELPTTLPPGSPTHSVAVGAMIDLGTLPGGTYSWAYAINARGQIVGGSGTADGEWHAFVVTTTPASNVVQSFGVGNRVTGPGSVVTTSAPAGTGAGAVAAPREPTEAARTIRERFGPRRRLLEQMRREASPR